MSHPNFLGTREAVLAALLFFAPMAAAEDHLASFIIVKGDTLWLTETLEVLGSRVPVALPGVVRTMNVVMEGEAEMAAARSVGELLQSVPGVVVSQRQQYGVQSDLTLRGSTFDQVQVLLNGFEAGDPQTGHHALDLPIGKRDISRIEVLPGHGSSLYGAGAFGGTVNVVTRRPAETSGGRVEMTGGDNGIWGAQAEADLRLGANTGSRLSFEKFRTDGYDVDQPDGSVAWGGNDADTWSGTGRVVHEGAGGEWDVFGAYSDREYGALDFYAPFRSYEKTQSTFASALYRTDVSDRITLEPRAFYRRHRDEFILFRDNPDAYTNDHVTQKTGGGLKGVVRLNGAHALAVSLEAVYEDIDSRGLRGGTWGEALGFHIRRRASVAAELNRNQGPLRWQAGGRVDRQTNYDARFSGSGAVSYELDPHFTLRASAGSVYRLPTFTDLYYRDPANVGNPAAVPETGWTWDTGLEFNDGPWSGQVTYYERYEEDLIEWARPLGDPLWHVMNIAEGTTRGGEVYGSWRHGAGHRLGLGWSKIDKDTALPDGFEGKYTLLVPSNVLTAQAMAALHRSLHWTLTGRYVEHSGGPDDFQKFFVLDSRIDWQGDTGWLVSFTGTNLSDRRYEEVPGVQMPGTVFTGSVGHHF
ncbi:MAG: TonB-dependent receptor [Candidatus Krumholzibacteria bacterium]|nr:TonB-dependent receptor [Candidatus Krumholzibacteria bacterium]